MSTLNEAVSHALDASDNPESDAIALFHYLMSRFGWTGTVMTREDVESIAERGLTDEEWEAVLSTKEWRDAASMWNEVGVTWDSVYSALDTSGVWTEEQT